MTDTIFNRQQTLKKWEPMQPIHLPTEVIQYYKQKIQHVCEKEGCDTLEACDLINIEGEQPLIDVNYVKYVALKHIDGIIQYMTSKGIVLNDIEWNIRLILNEITTNKVSEDYYLNTIDIYESIGGLDYDDIYGLINQAIKFNNKRLLYYLIFKEDYDMSDRVFEITRE